MAKMQKYKLSISFLFVGVFFLFLRDQQKNINNKNIN